MAVDISFGWVPPEERTPDQQDRHLEIMRTMPVFAAPPVAGGKPPVGTKLLLPKIWDHPKVIAYYGKAFRGLFQFTGSCVGVGGGNLIITEHLLEVVQNNEPEQLTFPWFWFNYGMSRKRAGFRGQGEGSFGSTFADSWSKDGCPSRESLDLTFPSRNDKGWRWDKNFELKWSDGGAMSSQIIEEAKPRTGTSTPVFNGESVRDFILNGYGCTRASMRFVNPGSAQVKGDALIGTHNGRGGHQESWLGYWNHPNLGELIWEQNQWDDAYGFDPGEGPVGGCWISMDTVNAMCQEQSAEVFAFSMYNGYPAQPSVYDWVNQSFLS